MLVDLLVIEIHFHVLSKSRTIIVSYCFGISEALKKRVTVKDLTLHRHSCTVN